MRRSVNVGDGSDLLMTFPTLSPTHANALVRAARLYRDALWVADEDPSEAWIRLVSAIETAAASYAQLSGTPGERLIEAMPELTAKLQEAGGDDLVASIAVDLAHLVKSTGRFLDFAMAHLPRPPPVRPPEPERMDWPGIRGYLKVVYDWRSRALHDGIALQGHWARRRAPERPVVDTGSPARRPRMPESTASGPTPTTARSAESAVWCPPGRAPRRPRRASSRAGSRDDYRVFGLGRTSLRTSTEEPYKYDGLTPWPVPA